MSLYYKRMTKILVFGDSIVFGKNVAHASNWVSQLNGFCERELDGKTLTFNLGIPGEASGGLLARLKSEIQARTKQKKAGDVVLIIFATGLNDAKRIDGKSRTPVATFKQNIKKSIDSALDHADAVLVVGPEKVSEKVPSDFHNEDIQKYNDALRDIASSSQVSFVDLFSSWPDKSDSPYTDDGVHPNQQGHTVIYRLVVKALLTTLEAVRNRTKNGPD